MHGIMSVIPALRNLRQKDHKFKISLGYRGRPSLKNKKQKYPAFCHGNKVCVSEHIKKLTLTASDGHYQDLPILPKKSSRTDLTLVP
jgi:hypothetical protein